MWSLERALGHDMSIAIQQKLCVFFADIIIKDFNNYYILEFLFNKNILICVFFKVFSEVSLDEESI